jgi:ornithine carbamoyltransferase
MTPLAEMTPPALYGRDFLTLEDFLPLELSALLDFATLLKRQKRDSQVHPWLAGKSVALYFEKPSNRTRVSFEVGVFDLGAHPIYLRKEEINLGVRETIADTARTLSRYVDGIMIRTFAHGDVEELAKWATVPVINGLTDDHHPCQVLADLMTCRERYGDLRGRKLAYLGDGNNMAHSLLMGCTLMGMEVAIATPPGFEPCAKKVDQANRLADEHGGQVRITHDIQEAVSGSDVVYTDVWASMGQELEAETRRNAFAGFQVNRQVMNRAKSEAIVLHCLPAHRGEEIDADTLEAHADSIFEQAENRLHAQKAVMVALMYGSSALSSS